MTWGLEESVGKDEYEDGQGKWKICGNIERNGLESLVVFNQVVDYYNKSFFPGKNITTPTILKGKFLPQDKLLVITPKGILFISQTDLVKHLQIPVNASNIEDYPF